MVAKGDGGVATPPSVGTHQDGETHMSANFGICSQWLKWWIIALEIAVIFLHLYTIKD